MAPTTIDDIFETLEFLDGWEERYRFIIDLGRTLPPMHDALKTEGSRVEGCMSQVWLVGTTEEAVGERRLGFVADSDALIVRGLIAVLLAIYSGRTADQILAVDIDGVFERLGFGSHISVNRRNGFYAMVERVKAIAREHASAPGAST